MYAIVKTGGKQYKVAVDDVLTVEKIKGEPGAEVILPALLLVDGDDVFFDPIGTSFQAAITGPTEEGVTYWIQVGGFKNPEIFGGGEAQSGRLKLEVRVGE